LISDPKLPANAPSAAIRDDYSALTFSRVGKAEAGDHETAPMPSAENRPRLECQLRGSGRVWP